MLDVSIQLLENILRNALHVVFRLFQDIFRDRYFRWHVSDFMLPVYETDFIG